MTDSNSRNVPWKWLAATLTVVIIALIGAWANDITRRTSVVEVHAATQAARIAAMETGLSTILSRLDRIDDKLDQAAQDRRR